MKVQVVRLMVILQLMALPSFAESDWVRQFLARYSPERAALSARYASAKPSSLAAMVQNGVIPLTTADIVRLLLENNRDLTVSRGVPVSNLYSIFSFYAPFQPNFQILGKVTSTTTPSASVLAGAASLKELHYDLNVNYEHTLPTGTVYSVGFDFLRRSTNSVFEVYNPAYDGTVSYGITQHFLRDYGRNVNEHLIRIARNDEKISEVQFELEIVDSVTNALQSYWDLVFSAEDVKVKQRSLDLASKTLEDNKVQVQVGSLAPIDLVQAEAEVATRYDDLITAKYNIAQQQDQMKKLISSDTDPGLVLAQLNLIEPVRQPGSEPLLPLTQAIEFALENRREMKEADYDLASQEINIQYTRNQKRPVFDLTLGYTHFGLGGTQHIRSSLDTGAEVVEVIPGGVLNMFRQLYSFNFPGYTAGFTLQIPLLNRAAQADYDRAINERELSTMRKAATAQRIVVEVRNAYTQLEMYRARVMTARTARELSARRLDAEQKKYDLGTSTVRFVLEEQRNLAQAETNEIQALVNYTKALTTYDRAIGNTLTRNSIVLDEQLPRQVTSYGTGGSKRLDGSQR